MKVILQEHLLLSSMKVMEKCPHNPSDNIKQYSPNSITSNVSKNTNKFQEIVLVLSEFQQVFPLLLIFWASSVHLQIHEGIHI